MGSFISTFCHCDPLLALVSRGEAEAWEHLATPSLTRLTSCVPDLWTSACVSYSRAKMPGGLRREMWKPRRRPSGLGDTGDSSRSGYVDLHCRVAYVLLQKKKFI